MAAIDLVVEDFPRGKHPQWTWGRNGMNSKDMFTKIDYPFLLATFASFVFSVLALWVGVRVVLVAADIKRLRGK